MLTHKPDDAPATAAPTQPAPARNASAPATQPAPSDSAAAPALAHDATDAHAAPAEPTAGGSYKRGAGGDLERVEGPQEPSPVAEGADDAPQPTPPQE